MDELLNRYEELKKGIFYWLCSNNCTEDAIDWFEYYKLDYEETDLARMLDNCLFSRNLKLLFFLFKKGANPFKDYFVADHTFFDELCSLYNMSDAKVKDFLEQVIIYIVCNYHIPKKVINRNNSAKKLLGKFGKVLY